MVALGLEESRAVEVAVQAIEEGSAVEDEERCGRWGARSLSKWFYGGEWSRLLTSVVSSQCRP